MDLRDLAKELEDLSDRFAYDPSSLTEDEKERIAALHKLEKGLGCSLEEQAEADPYFIAGADFEDYAREQAEDMYGKELKSSKWPFNCIDWSEAADELMSDYLSVDFDGETYYYRHD